MKSEICVKVHVPNFGGLSGSEDRGGGDNSIQFINFGRVGDKSFKEWRHKIGGGGVEGWVTTIFRLFRTTVLDKKMPLSFLLLYTFAYLLNKRNCMLDNFFFSYL